MSLFSIYPLWVVLRGIGPLNWRCILVHKETTRAQLHDILQIALAWSHEHPHSFHNPRQRVRQPWGTGLPSPAVISGPPMLYRDSQHGSPVRGDPGDLLLIQGFNFSPSAYVIYQAIADTTQRLSPPSRSRERLLTREN